MRHWSDVTPLIHCASPVAFPLGPVGLALVPIEDFVLPLHFFPDWTITVHNGRVVLDMSAGAAFELGFGNNEAWPIMDAIINAADEAKYG